MGSPSTYDDAPASNPAPAEAPAPAPTSPAPETTNAQPAAAPVAI